MEVMQEGDRHPPTHTHTPHPHPWESYLSSFPVDRNSKISIARKIKRGKSRQNFFCLLLLDPVVRPGPEYGWLQRCVQGLTEHRSPAPGSFFSLCFSLCLSLSLLAFSGHLIIPGGMHCPHPSVPHLPSGRGSSDCPLHPSL